MATGSNTPADAGDKIVKFKRRRSKSDDRDREILNRFNESRQLAATMTWPEIPRPRDWAEQTDDELGDLDFEGMPEFRGDGVGAGTPEFRKQLEAYFQVVTTATRHALGILGLSRRELTDAAVALKMGPNEEDDCAYVINLLLRDGYEYALRLAHCLKAAGVRQICAMTLRDMEAEKENEPPPPAETSRGAA
jgi:hypothetical protein